MTGCWVGVKWNFKWSSFDVTVFQSRSVFKRKPKCVCSYCVRYCSPTQSEIERSSCSCSGAWRLLLHDACLAGAGGHRGAGFRGVCPGAVRVHSEPLAGFGFFVFLLICFYHLTLVAVVQALCSDRCFFFTRVVRATMRLCYIDTTSPLCHILPLIV